MKIDSSLPILNPHIGSCLRYRVKANKNKPDLISLNSYKSMKYSKIIYSYLLGDLCNTKSNKRVASDFLTVQTMRNEHIVAHLIGHQETVSASRMTHISCRQSRKSFSRSSTLSTPLGYPLLNGTLSTSMLHIHILLSLSFLFFEFL